MEGVDSQFRALLQDNPFVQPFVESDLGDCPSVEDPSGLKLQVKLNGVDQPVLIDTFQYADVIVGNIRNAFAQVLLSKRLVYIRVSDFSKAVRFNPELIEMHAKAGNLGLILTMLKTITYVNDNQWQKDFADTLEEEVLKLGASRTGILLNTLKTIVKWCQENRSKIEKALAHKNKYSPHQPYIVFKKDEPDTKLPFTLEIRSLFDVVVRYQKNFTKGTLSVLSKHLCLMTGFKYVKLKRGIDDRYKYSMVQRFCKLADLKNELEVLNRLANLSHVVQVVRKAEFAEKYKKIPSNSFNEFGMFVPFRNRLEHRVYLYLEELEGETLHEKTASQQSLSQKVSYMMDIATGLEALHGAGVLHRDLKPNNMKVTSKGVVLFDFDLSDFRGVMQALFKGTPIFIDPLILYKDIVNSLKADERKKQQKEDEASQLVIDAPAVSEKKVKEESYKEICESSVDIYTFGVIMFLILTERKSYPIIINHLDNNRYYEFINNKTREYLSDSLRVQQQKIDRAVLADLKIPEHLITIVLSAMDPLPSRRPSLSDIKRELSKPLVVLAESINGSV
jgi:serine/threonine protein kinase